MRYALLIYGVSGAAAPGALAEERPAEAGGPSGDGVFDDWVAYTRALKRAGVLVGAERVHVADLDAAIDWAAQMPHIRRGTVEVRPVQVGMAWQAVLAE